MCGIAGILASGTVAVPTVTRMTAPIVHRGPDDGGCWIDADAGIGLGHRRLAIVDLSAAGHQPMHSADGRFVLTYNGEIYNHQAIRRELEQCNAIPEGGWRGHSDTEVLLQAIATWGLKAAIERSVGMFALALWDRRNRRLSLVRDRFGEKPLYYGWAGDDFVFGSELKALRAHPRFDGKIDRRSVALFASRTYIPAPLSIYEGVFKLRPGCILSLGREAAAERLIEAPREGNNGHGLSLEPYWSYRDVITRGLGDPIEDEAEALGALEGTLATAIQGQSMADVPVGAFLSGGIDSSTVVALYQKYSSRPVHTFSIGFEEAGYNEAEHAKQVAKHLGTVHQERYVTVKEARDVIPLLPAIYDEPFADSSQIPTYLVSRFAREQVTVALTGDGGDELFAGYNRHFRAPQLWEQLRHVPKPLRTAAAAPLSLVPSQLWNRIGGMLPGSRQPHFGAKLQKGLRVAGAAQSFDDVYGDFLDEWSFERSPVIGAQARENGFDLDLGCAAPNAVRTMFCDAVTYLPDDILAKVDRASMAVSLETRVPFLDHRVAELAARIPLSLKVRGNKGKWLVRQLLYGLVPSAFIERPKAGFAVPVGEWIKGPLRPWAEELLSPASLAADGFLDAQVVRRRWADHLSGRRDSSQALWAVLMLQAWMIAQQSGEARAA